MSFNPTWNVSACKSSLTPLQAGDLGWPQLGDRRFGKTCRRGWQPLELRFGRETDELKRRTNYELES